MGRLIVVSGTGTGIGKTHLSEALLRALGAVVPRVAGLKPIETGLAQATISDAERLERASTFHVEHFCYLFAEPISPHLAARASGEPITLAPLARSIESVRQLADVTLVELAGGLFTPLSDEEVNADLARELCPDEVLLVLPDRLGVLHDALAATRAAATVPLAVDGFVLVAPETPDSSTGRNAAELQRISPVPVLARVPRASVSDLATSVTLRELAAGLLR